MDADSVPDLEPRPAIQFFAGQLAPVPIPFRYQIGLCAVAGAMIVLPLVYLGLVGVAAWGTYFYATHSLNLFFPIIGGTRRIHFGLLVLYLIPLLVGVILTLFMIKPLFARRRSLQVACPISHLDHPDLFRFIGQLCQVMGAPIPSRVDVNLSVNASAGFRAGFSSLFGNDIMLTIGLPLVAGMTCQEFAGVLAHELGHFTQRTAMRFSFIITSINHWLGRAVYERDAWDDALEEAAHLEAVNLVICTVAQIGIALTRGILWLLMVTGHALSSFMSRQMEFHADAYAVAVAGTEGTLTMRQKLHVLDACIEQASAQFKNRVQPKFPDDLSTYIAMLASQCAAPTQGKVLRAASGIKTRWFHSHPSDAERTARARQANAPGLLQDPRPATVLFGRFSELSRSLTAFHYQLAFGRPLTPDRAFTVEAPTNAVPDTTAEEAAVKSYFGGCGLILRPILIEPGTRLGVGLVSAKVEQLQHAKTVLQSPGLLALRESLKQLDAQWLQLLQATALQQAGFELDEATLSRIGAAGLNPAEWLANVEQQLEQLRYSWEPFEQAAKTRLMTGLSLLRTPVVAAELADTEQLQDEVLDLLHVYGKVSATFPALLQLRKEFVLLQTLLGVRGSTRSELLDGALAESRTRSVQLLAQVKELLGSTGYPFEHPKGHVSILEYACSKEFEAEPVRMLYKEVECHLQMLFALYYRLLARLIAIATQVEAQLERSGPTLQA